MKNTGSVSLAVLALALLGAHCAAAASAPYFPYEKIDKYYTPPPEAPAPPPAPQPAAPKPEPRQLKPSAVAGQPAPITVAPEFLFPAKLGFGVAVGVPYDLIYIEPTYYYWQEGAWFRSTSYRGPWIPTSYSQLPPELRKHPLAKIRAQRNAEFRTYWKNRDRYQGKRFHPDNDAK